MLVEFFGAFQRFDDGVRILHLELELNQLDSGIGQRIKGLEAQLQQVTSSMHLDLRRALKE